MLTKLTIRNFKRFDEVEIELGNPVLFIGPNNSGKTTALQALTLWEIGLRRWIEKVGEGTLDPRGATVNRRDLVATPVPDAGLLWSTADRAATPLQIEVQGEESGSAWTCTVGFEYGNEESLYSRFQVSAGSPGNGIAGSVPAEAGKVRSAFLSPMSGLIANEARLEPGAVDVRVGEGRTSEVLRNICHRIATESPAKWESLSEAIAKLFGVRLQAPEYLATRGEIVMQYVERGRKLDLICSGRGFQQTLLLLAYMRANPGAVVLLDEPDAHLEIIRQREIYQTLTDVARETGSQIIAASHSEILLNEAAGRDVVVAFLGKPHRLNDRGAQLLKSLREIGWEDYYQAEQTGWVLYLEGSTDLAFLRAFAQATRHDAAVHALERPFVTYIGNQPRRVSSHFYGLREAARELKAVAIFDRLDQEMPEELREIAHTWKRREIENYVCMPEVLESYAGSNVEVMRASIREVSAAMATLRKGLPWDPGTKVSDEFLDPLFRTYYEKLGIPNLMAKTNFHELARFVPARLLDPEVTEKLDAIARVAGSATCA